MIELTEVKKYLRISHELDDTYINSLIEFSKQFIKEQSGVEYNEKDSVYNMTILQAVAHFYDKREAVSDKSAVNVPYTLDCLIKHLGMRGAYSE